MTPSQPFAVGPDEGETFRAGPFRIVSRVQGSQSGGSLEVYELTLEPSTIDYHVHNTMDETLGVLEGEIEFNLAGTKLLRPAGSVAFAPRGVHHGFVNHGPGPARVLIIFNPARNQHEYFRELERLFAASPLDTDALHELQRRYDQELVAG
jgi:quercetin dioxygenase-like cupin family protein